MVDYGGGNVGSLVSALEKRGARLRFVCDADEAASCSALVLPGDGAFGPTMAALCERGLDAAIVRAIAAGVPFLGICVGMHVLYERGVENGDFPGMAIFEGTVGRFEKAPRVPHMGWNALDVRAAHPFLNGVRSGDYAYFLHSYRADVDRHTIAACEHGERFAAIVARGNVIATQFHPEKSGTTGARLLDNFLRLCAGARA